MNKWLARADDKLQVRCACLEFRERDERIRNLLFAAAQFAADAQRLSR